MSPPSIIKYTTKCTFYPHSLKVQASTGYIRGVSATTPGAFEVNLLTAGIPEGASIQLKLSSESSC